MVAAVFLAGAVLVLRVDNDDDDEARLKADRGRAGLLRILPMRWISRLAALVMVVMAGITLADAFR